jgi:hypothetical protein
MAIKVARHASGQIYRVYESTTGETVQPLAPVVWYDDFLGDAIDARWATVDVGNATQALLADQSSGICRLALTSTDEAQDAVLSMDGSLVLDCESDDTTNDTNGASSTTWTTGNFGILRIDFGTIADVKLYLDGSRIVSGTTFDMSNLTAGEQQMQPYLSLDKASGATLCTLDIDYVRVFSTR